MSEKRQGLQKETILVLNMVNFFFKSFSLSWLIQEPYFWSPFSIMIYCKNAILITFLWTFKNAHSQPLIENISHRQINERKRYYNRSTLCIMYTICDSSTDRQIYFRNFEIFPQHYQQSKDIYRLSEFWTTWHWAEWFDIVRGEAECTMSSNEAQCQSFQHYDNLFVGTVP